MRFSDLPIMEQNRVIRALLREVGENPDNCDVVAIRLAILAQIH